MKQLGFYSSLRLAETTPTVTRQHPAPQDTLRLWEFSCVGLCDILLFVSQSMTKMILCVVLLISVAEGKRMCLFNSHSCLFDF